MKNIILMLFVLLANISFVYAHDSVDFNGNTSEHKNCNSAHNEASNAINNSYPSGGWADDHSWGSTTGKSHSCESRWRNKDSKGNITGYWYKTSYHYSHHPNNTQDRNGNWIHGGRNSEYGHNH